MQEPIRRGAKDPAVVRATAGLAAYLRELVLSARRPVRDCAHYETQVWLADLPEGVDRPSATPMACCSHSTTSRLWPLRRSLNR
jgi:hypothetical protein